MLMPSIFGENLFDDFFDDYFPFDTDKELHKAEKKLYGRRAGHVMKTDIKEKDNGYEFEIDLPGFAKDEVKVSLENGYMTIEAAKGLDKDEKEKETGKYPKAIGKDLLHPLKNSSIKSPPYIPMIHESKLLIKRIFFNKFDNVFS